MAPDRHMRAHLVVTGKYGSISYIITKQSTDTGVSHALLYLEKMAPKGQVALIKIKLKCVTGSSPNQSSLNVRISA